MGKKSVYVLVDLLPEMSKLLIVGAGLTGSLTAALLQRTSLPLTVTIWDKARGAGGRMSTHRDPEHPTQHVDMGAQYISRTKDKHPGYESLMEGLYDELISHEVLVPFCGSIEGERADLTKFVIQNYVGPKGANSIAKYFLAQSKAEVSYQQNISEVNIETDSQIACKCASLDENRHFDHVIFTLPVPQFLTLGGNISSTLDPTTHSNLSSIRYSSRYALGLFYAKPVQSSWSAKYFDDPVIRFASWDTAKRGCSGHGNTLLLHTSVPFGIEHLEKDKEEVRAKMLKRLEEVLPGLPPHDHSHVIRWRYSQVSRAYPGSPGCLVLSHKPLVIVTGDGFVGSNFENCVKAAQVTTQTVLDHFSKQTK